MAAERDIDCMKYRKSTHIASVDVETMIADNGSCHLTIKDAFYDKGVDVSGSKTDGYFLTFVEGVKPMVANSGNRKTIANIAKTLKGITAQESRNLTNWIGLKIELIVDPTVKMMGQVVGGIKVAPTSPIPNISDVNALAILNSSKVLKDLQANWSKLSKDEQSLPTVNALKDKLKTKLPND